MRKWFKYLVVDESESISSSKNVTFQENAEEMQYDSQVGFSSQEEFIKTYFFGHRRYQAYDSILRSILRKDERALSIGSGRCINEILLAKDGYDITCSDLGVLSRVKSFFPSLNFICYDMTQKAFFKTQFDVIFAFSSFYLFDRLQFREILNNLKNSLKERGRLIIDIGGSQDNFPAFLIDNLISQYEAYLKVLILKFFIKSRKKVIRRHHGFRYADKEFIKLVQGEGFRFLRVDRSDYLTELGRSYIVRRIGGLCGFFNNLFGIIGRASPYVRVFIFEKSD